MGSIGSGVKLVWYRLMCVIGGFFILSYAIGGSKLEGVATWRLLVPGSGLILCGLWLGKKGLQELKS